MLTKKGITMIYIFYNPYSGSRCAEAAARHLSERTPGDSTVLSIIEYNNMPDFFENLTEADTLIICGGDGTLNHFINLHDCDKIKADIAYYPSGSGNDFAHDIGLSPDAEPISVKRYLRNLPTVTVKDRTYKFLDNVGYGIDGYCCEMGDISKEKSDKAVNYTTIAIKGVLFDFKPRNATVTVDGVTKEYKRVWLAPTLKGRYFGGGMMATPDQDRLAADGHLSLLVFHDSGKLRLLSIFPRIFNGTHVKYTKYVDILTGHEITIEFDRPTPLQIDGETIRNVLSYTARSEKNR